MNYVSDDALSIYEWHDYIESEGFLDMPAFAAPADFYFIMCADQTVMIEKDYYMLLLLDFDEDNLYHSQP